LIFIFRWWHLISDIRFWREAADQVGLKVWYEQGAKAGFNAYLSQASFCINQ
jgi:hypothetical protein